MGVLRPAPRMADSVSYQLEKPSFLKAFKAVQHMLVCHTVGDAAVYDAYFEKQCSENNAHALEL